MIAGDSKSFIYLIAAVLIGESVISHPLTGNIGNDLLGTFCGLIFAAAVTFILKWRTDKIKSPRLHAQAVGLTAVAIFSLLSFIICIMRFSEYAARVEFTEQDMQSFVKELMQAITILMNEVTRSGGTIVVISAETGFQPAPFDVIDNIYREALCTVNQRVANMADEAYFSFSGLQLRVK